MISEAAAGFRYRVGDFVQAPPIMDGRWTDVAVSTHWWVLGRQCGAPSKGFTIDIRQV